MAFASLREYKHGYVASLNTELLRKMDGPCSRYSARVLHTDANSGMLPSTDPPNLRARVQEPPCPLPERHRLCMPGTLQELAPLPLACVQCPLSHTGAKCHLHVICTAAWHRHPATRSRAQLLPLQAYMTGQVTPPDQRASKAACSSYVLSACGSRDSHVRARACTPGCVLLPRVTGHRHMQCPAASLRHARIYDPLRRGRRHQLSRLLLACNVLSTDSGRRGRAWAQTVLRSEHLDDHILHFAWHLSQCSLCLVGKSCM